MAYTEFPLQFKRQYSAPLDKDGVFQTITDMTAYLLDPVRYAGQIATCIETPDKMYILSEDLSEWIEVSGGTGGGHIIKSDLESFTQRGGLKFIGDVIVTDDVASDSTVVEVVGGSITEVDPEFNAWLDTDPLSGYSPTNHNHTGVYEPANSNIQSHISSTANPHSVTKSQVGLGSVDNTSDVNKPISIATQSALDKKQTVFTGICQEQYLTENDIVIDNVNRTLTIATVKNGEVISALNPICFYTDGNGVAVRHTKSAQQVFNFTDTTGVWYFYFNSNGDPIATQTIWNDFSTIATVYRLYWNSNLASDKDVIHSVEYHKNDISWTDHAWKHSEGTRWLSGFEISHNRLISGAPSADGSNTVISLSTGSNMDDNLIYTLTNSSSGPAKFTQNLGTGLLPATSGKFMITYNNSATDLRKLLATDFPFSFNNTTNLPEYITSTGIRTTVPNGDFFVYYIYALQDPRYGETIKLRSAEATFTTETLAKAHSWEQLQSIFPTLRDGEIRLLYKLTFEYRTTYDIACKKTVLRSVDDLRRQKTTTSATSGGSLPATSITFSPSGAIGATNVQSALEELDIEKIPISDKGSNDGIATLDSEGFVPSSQLRTLGSDVIELLEITALIGEVIDMIEGDKVFDTSDNKIYTYTSGVWYDPVTPDANKLYLCKADTLTYKWNGVTLITTSSPLPYASTAVNIIGTSASTVTSPSSTFGSFKYWVANTVFSSLTTGVQNITGAINELKYGKQEGTTNNITPTASGGTYTILNNRINNLRSVWLLAGTHNLNLATVSDNNIINEQYIIFRTGATVPTINFVQPYYIGQGTVAITSGSTSVTVAGTNAQMVFKANQTFIANGITYTVSSVTNSTTIVLSVAAGESFTGSYTYRPMLNYVYFPTTAINQLWHISFLYSNNGNAWVCDISVRVI